MTAFVTLILTAAVGFAPQSPEDELRARAGRLHREAIVVDAHADLTPFIEKDTKVGRDHRPASRGRRLRSDDRSSPREDRRPLGRELSLRAPGASPSATRMAIWTFRAFVKEGSTPSSSPSTWRKSRVPGWR